jgi:hypothetical protein
MFYTLIEKVSNELELITIEVDLMSEDVGDPWSRSKRVTSSSSLNQNPDIHDMPVLIGVHHPQPLYHIIHWFLGGSLAHIFSFLSSFVHCQPSSLLHAFKTDSSRKKKDWLNKICVFLSPPTLGFCLHRLLQITSSQKLQWIIYWCYSHISI